MTNCEIETGFQLFARLTTRPTLENIHPILIPNCGPHKQEVIEVVGDTSTGKTMLVTEFIARCLLPEKQYNLEIGGKNSGAVIINTDQHFHIFKLTEIMEDIVKKCVSDTNNISSTQMNDIVTTSLNNLIILNCFNSEQMYVTFHNLETILANNDRISLLVLDSISAYYWGDRLGNGIRKIGLYQKTILRSLQNMTKDYNLVIMFTKPSSFTSKKDSLEYCYKQPTLEKINYRIFLEKDKTDSNKFIATVTLPDNVKFEKFYKISKFIEWI